MAAGGERRIDDVEAFANPFGLTVTDENDLHSEIDRRGRPLLATDNVGPVSDPLGPAGWHPDPTGRYEYRYFNGQQWTGDVSTHGQRFIDSGGPPTSQHERGPSRGMAIAAFVVGLLALFLSWIPFVFLLGGAGAITAFVFGVLGTRAAARNQRYGQGYAIAGIVLSVLALAMCTVGFLFTRVVLREVNAYLDPGPHEVSITVCDMRPQTGLDRKSVV